MVAARPKPLLIAPIWVSVLHQSRHVGCLPNLLGSFGIYRVAA